ncbi:auxin efflux carrier [Candidatus Vecturithrix granuli]|uniref:Auxin efflux carrier n=1 Tax=Vecturithrix granuli TaxID=1499967 RepID=A0A0S6W9B8_VECG1|nr:auxin efflux carrier [Candidatus Vecturithrix granuli]
MTKIFFSVLPVLTLFVLGYLLQRIYFFKERSIGDIKKLVVSIALPCLLFRAFSQLELQPKFLVVVVLVFGICGIMLMLGEMLAHALHISSPYFPILLGGFETGMLGYAIFIAVYGIDEIDKLAIIDLGQVLFVFFVLMALLMKHRDGAQSVSQLVKMFLSSPVIISIFLGIFVSLVKGDADYSTNRMVHFVGQVMTLLGNLTVPLICLVIGYELKFDFHSARLSVKTIIIRKIFLIAFALLMNKVVFVRILHLEPIYEYALLAMFLMPPPFVIALFLKEEDQENQQYVVNTLSLSTIVSIGLFIVISMVYR